MTVLDETHDARRRSWVVSANDHPDFPLQNLPFGCFSPADGGPRAGVAIGERIFDLGAALSAGSFTGPAADAAAAAANGADLNRFLALGSTPRAALRQAVFALLAEGSPERHDLVHDAAACTLHLPARIGDYSDFFAGIHHATNTGNFLRLDAPLNPNYKHMPVAYHGRASSIQPSGAAIRRPKGQRKAANEAAPSYGPTRCLDFELEMGIWIGPGNALGTTIPIARAAEQIAGYCLFNDCSARDFQGWESQPLGPFLGKNFASTVSPWIVTPEALAPFRVAQTPRSEGDPQLLDYLWNASDQQEGAIDLGLKVLLLTPRMKAQNAAPQLLSRSNMRHLYWTPAQLIAHHGAGGCNLRPGDLVGTGTISAPTPDGFGCLLELTRGGKEPIRLASGETRLYLEDGDEIVFREHAARDGYAAIGLGECRTAVLPAI